MAATLSGWTSMYTKGLSGKTAHFKETITFTSATTDVTGTEFGQGVSGGPIPPAGVDFQVTFVQNNTMSTAGDIVLQGADASGGDFTTIKDDLVAYAAATTAAGQSTSAQNDVSANGELPVYQFLLDADGIHSGETTNGTAEIHMTWVIPSL